MRIPFPKTYRTQADISLNSWPKETVLEGLFACLIVVVCLNALSGTVADPDLWGYLAFGRLFWETGRFPYQDIFAYVPTLKFWVYHEWLTGVLFYPIYRTLGAAGLQAVKLALGLATVYLIYLTARRRGANFWSALLGVWCVQVFLAMGYSPVRAQLFTYLFFALSLFMLESARLSGRWRGLIVLVLIQIFWCNLHGGFLAGLGLLALYGLGEAVSRRPFWPYLAAVLAASLVTLINPYGLDYWHYLFRAVTMPRPEITEWASVFKAWQAGFPKEPLLYFASLAGFAVLLALWAKWREITPGLIMLLTLYLGFKHLRHQVFFFLAAGAYLPVLLEAFGQKILSSPPFVSWKLPLGRLALVTLAVCGIMIYGYKFLSKNPLTLTFPVTPDPSGKVGIHYPVNAVEFLQKNRLSGNILNEFNWGEYLIWTLHPSSKVAMDGRYETVYGDDLCRLHSEFFYGRPGWRQILAQFPPDLILVDPRSKVYALLQDAPDWRQAYRDEGAALFLPRDKNPALSLNEKR
jgi:hypothetical protein